MREVFNVGFSRKLENVLEQYQCCFFGAGLQTEIVSCLESQQNNKGLSLDQRLYSTYHFLFLRINWARDKKGTNEISFGNISFDPREIRCFLCLWFYRQLFLSI